jgi:hypothetical protein
LLAGKLEKTSKHSKWQLQDFFNSKAKETFALFQVLYQQVSVSAAVPRSFVVSQRFR